MITISSRTPEGQPNRCPVCCKEVRIEASKLFGDAPCPNCGCLLWFVSFSSKDRIFYEQEAGDLMRERIIEYLVNDLGVSREALESNSLEGLKINSLDIAELVMALEDEYEIKKVDS
jgi:acyl carrier protein